MLATEHNESCARETFADNARILHVVVYLFVGLSLSFRREYGEAAFLSDVGCAVEHGRLPPVPIAVQRPFVRVFRLERPRDDGPSQPHAGEAGRFGEALYLDGALSGARYLVDASGQGTVPDVFGIRRVEDDDASVRERVVHERFQLLAAHRGAGRIVGRTEVQEIRAFVRESGNEAVCLHRVQVDDAASGNDVGIAVHGIDGVLHGGDALVGKDARDVGAIGLRAVADEDLVRPYRDAARGVPFCESFSQARGSLLVAAAGVRFA